MIKEPEQIFFFSEKTFIWTTGTCRSTQHRQGNANQNHNEIPPQSYQMAIIKVYKEECWLGYGEKANLVKCW